MFGPLWVTQQTSGLQVWANLQVALKVWTLCPQWSVSFQKTLLMEADPRGSDRPVRPLLGEESWFVWAVRMFIFTLPANTFFYRIKERRAAATRIILCVLVTQWKYFHFHSQSFVSRRFVGKTGLTACLQEIHASDWTESTARFSLLLHQQRRNEKRMFTYSLKVFFIFYMTTATVPERLLFRQC